MYDIVCIEDNGMNTCERLSESETCHLTWSNDGRATVAAEGHAVTVTVMVLTNTESLSPVSRQLRQPVQSPIAAPTTCDAKIAAK
jgi:hypothetical protein